MAMDRRKRQLMQEALDETLPLEDRRRLLADLDRDPQATAAFRRLREVDRLLRTAPFEHAPRTLALAIMSRVMEGLKQPHLSRLSGLALALALSLVTLVVVPLLAGAAWLFLNTLGSASALASLMQTLAGLLALALAAVNVLVESAQDFVETYPYTPGLMVTLVPVGLYWIAGRAARARRAAEEL